LLDQSVVPCSYKYNIPNHEKKQITEIFLKVTWFPNNRAPPVIVRDVHIGLADGGPIKRAELL
jgi:hypothetical protein